MPRFGAESVVHRRWDSPSLAVRRCSIALELVSFLPTTCPAPARRQRGRARRRPRWTPRGGTDLLRRARERVPVEHHQVGHRPDLDHSGSVMRSRWFTHALPEVYAANAVSRSSACSGRNGSVPARPASPYDVRRHGGVDRGQRVGGRDRPVAAGDQPGAGAVQVAEGVLPARPLLPQERQREVVHLVVVAAPTAPACWRRRRARRTAGTSSGWISCRWAIWWRRAGSRPDHRVEGLADRPVADRVHVHLEAGRVQRARRRPDRLRVQEGVAACCRSAWPQRSR